jgi:hypothetical protein
MLDKMRGFALALNPHFSCLLILSRRNYNFFCKSPNRLLPPNQSLKLTEQAVDDFARSKIGVTIGRGTKKISVLAMVERNGKATSRRVTNVTGLTLKTVIRETVESYFAIMKRGVVGVYHSISKQHLDRYCNEFSFRWNRRNITDGERADDAIKNAQGKLLIYKNQAA